MAVGSEYPFRVFISYSHADIEIVRKMAALLEEMGLHPLWDRDIHPGTPFTDTIKELIARSHIFIPLITENSHHRPWVHQETGFATALNLPIVPIAIDKNLPSEMIASLHAISVDADLNDLPDRLREVNLGQLVLPEPKKPHGVIEIAEWPEVRTEFLTRYAKWVIELGVYGHVRHRGILSSFSIPDKDMDDPVWKVWGKDTAQSDYLFILQREERRLLEQHTREAGCSLLIDPTTTLTVRGAEVRKSRLTTLLEFISAVPADKLHIVMSTKARQGNIVMVGDYFVAESAAPRPGGYVQTIFNTHPPTVLQKIRRFDQEFEDLYATEGVSLEAAQIRIKKIIDELK